MQLSKFHHHFFTFFILTIGLLCFTVSSAQFKHDYKRNADNFYAKGDYYSAALYYEKYLTDKGLNAQFDPYEVKKVGSKASKTKGKLPENNQQIIYRIASCYYSLNDYSNAEKWYNNTLGFDKTTYPNVKLYYGICLRANGKYAEAQQQFEGYLSEHKTQDDLQIQAKKELANCIFIQQELRKADVALYYVQKLAASVNVSGANYAPSGFGNVFVFTSTRKDSLQLTAKSKAPFINNLYETNLVSGSINNIQKTAIELPEGFEQGIASFTASGDKIFFTRWTKKQGKNIAAIYASNKVDGKWQTPVKLDAGVNEEGYSSQQPFISADGKQLLFASDKPGGQGKFDIWSAKIGSDFKTGKSSNLGATINTKDDEQAPFYHQQTKTLVFASNGRVGMGGFDLFQAKGSVDAPWAEPINMGAPINSVKDDIYFYNNNGSKLLKNAYISSDRASVCCLELFSADKTYKKYVSGVVSDCNTNLPLEGATISATDKATGKVILISQLTSAQGQYLFERENNQAITINANKQGYNIASIDVASVADDIDTLYNVKLCQTPIIIDTPKIIPPAPKKMYAHFDFNHYDLNEKESIAVLDTLAALLKREARLSLELDGYTDEIGSLEYNIKLSENRAKACMDYLIKAGIDASRLTIKGFGKCCPIMPETTPDGKDNPEARKVNRRVEFKITYL
jgi:outer membrane protein OmpA-like peptidoglycan-associated protein